MQAFNVDVPGLGKRVLLKGFKTDFASIPRLLWWIFPPATGKHRRAAVVHDYLYRYQELPRKQSDDAFLELMFNDGVNWFSRYIIYLGVRIGGWYAWNKRCFNGK